MPEGVDSQRHGQDHKTGGCSLGDAGRQYGVGIGCGSSRLGVYACIKASQFDSNLRFRTSFPVSPLIIPDHAGGLECHARSPVLPIHPVHSAAGNRDHERPRHRSPADNRYGNGTQGSGSTSTLGRRRTRQPDVVAEDEAGFSCSHTVPPGCSGGSAGHAPPLSTQAGGSGERCAGWWGCCERRRSACICAMHKDGWEAKFAIATGCARDV